MPLTELQRQHIQRALGRDKGVLQAHADLFQFLCACAVHDESFLMTFAKRSDGLYVHKGNQKIVGSLAEGSREAMQRSLLTPDECVGSRLPCPWCGAESLVNCVGCNMPVCKGRVDGEIFTCRDSCGARGLMISTKGLVGTKSAVAVGAKPEAMLLPAKKNLSLSDPRQRNLVLTKPGE